MDEQEYDIHKQKPTSPPKPPQLHAGIKTFTPASVRSDSCSTLTDDTLVADNDVTALNGLWKEFMKFVIQSKALKHHRTKSSKKDPCIKLDIKKLQKLQESRRVDQLKHPKTRKTTYLPTEMFDVSLGECKNGQLGTYTIPNDTVRSVDSREERINRLICEVRKP